MQSVSTAPPACWWRSVTSPVSEKKGSALERESPPPVPCGSDLRRRRRTRRRARRWRRQRGGWRRRRTGTRSTSPSPAVGRSPRCCHQRPPPLPPFVPCAAFPSWVRRLSLMGAPPFKHPLRPAPLNRRLSVISVISVPDQAGRWSGAAARSSPGSRPVRRRRQENTHDPPWSSYRGSVFTSWFLHDSWRIAGACRGGC